MTIFERIVNREIPGYILYEDDLVMAFLDISQTTMGHTLVIPKKSYPNIFEIPDDLFRHLMSVVRRLSIGIKDAFNASGINLINNNGAIAGQTVFHYHFHILPRYENDGFNIDYINNSSSLTDEDYKKRARIIQAQL